MVSTAVSECAVCGKDAHFRCQRCSEGLVPDLHSHVNIRYCSKDCHTSHWAKHKAECKAANERKVLWRAGQTLVKCFVHFRMSCFEQTIEHHETDHEGILHVHVKQRDMDEQLVRAWFGDDPLRASFSGDMQRQAVAVSGQGRSALAFTKIFCDKALQGEEFAQAS